MKYCDWSSKLEKILEQTDKETLYDFMRSYAETNQDLALALIEQFDRKDSDDAKAMVESVTMTYEEYISDLTRKITSSYGAFRWDYVEELVRYLLKHDELDEAHKAAQTYDSGGKAMVLLIDYLTEHQLYDEAIETNLEVKDTFTRYSNKLDEKLSDSIVEMAKCQNKSRDYRFVAEHVATFMKASPIAKEKGQELISHNGCRSWSPSSI